MQWATQVRAAAENSAASADTDAFDVPTLMRMCSVPEIDLLKIDVERSELESFFSEYGKLAASREESMH